MKSHEHFPLVPISRAEGPWLFDETGRRYFDAVSSWWVNLFGHGEPRICAAVSRQIALLDHVMLAGFTHEPAVRLAERLSSATGGRLGHAFFASDGASATEIALKMSAHYWRNIGRPGKNEFVCLAGSYHGETVGALAVTDVPLFRGAYRDLIRAAHVVASPDFRLAIAGESAADVARRAAADLESFLERNESRVAALIVEPLVQCASGFAMHDPVYLAEARKLCDRYQIHLICDEIAVGFGRTGTFFAHEQAVLDGIAIRPDFLCLSKGITGGTLPLSAVLTTPAVYSAFYEDSAARGFLHSHSYTGNPSACAAALATLDIFETDSVIASNKHRASRLTAALEHLAANPRIRDFRNRGMLWAFEVDAAPADFAQRCFAAGLAQEILLRPIGNTVYLMPPYVIDDELVAFIAERVSATLEAALDIDHV